MALYTTSNGTQKRLLNTMFCKERGKENYLLVYFQDEEAYCSLTDWDEAGSCPSMFHSGYSDDWLQECCARTSFRKLPVAWQEVFRNYIEADYC